MSRTSQAAVGPQVVIGLTAPSSAPPGDLSIPAAGDLPTGASLRADGVPKLEIVPEAFESNHAIPLVPAPVAVPASVPASSPIKHELDAAAPVAPRTERELDPSPLSESEDDSDDEAPITRRMSDEMVAAAVQAPPEDDDDAVAEGKPAAEVAAAPASPASEETKEAKGEPAASEAVADQVDEAVGEAASAPVETANAAEPAKSTESDDAAVSIPASDAPVVVSTMSSREESGVDEISIPPVGDLDVYPDPTEPMADHFFSQASEHGPDELEWEEGEAGKKAARKRAPEVVQRRERFARYVKWAVAGAAVVCLAAVGRTAMTPAASASASPAQAPVVAPAPAVEKAAEKTTAVIEPAAPVAPVVTANAPTETANTETPAAEPTKAEAPAAPAPTTAEVAPAASAPAPAAEPAKTSEGSPASAAEEKSAARKALERSKLADAIAHGERAVELDPTDGESWLILGAAYQEKGNVVDARRCYTACAKEGKRGPIGECRAMLR